MSLSLMPGEYESNDVTTSQSKQVFLTKHQMNKKFEPFTQIRHVVYMWLNYRPCYLVLNAQYQWFPSKMVQNKTKQIKKKKRKKKHKRKREKITSNKMKIKIRCANEHKCSGHLILVWRPRPHKNKIKK